MRYFRQKFIQLTLLVLEVINNLPIATLTSWDRILFVICCIQNNLSLNLN